MKGDLSSSRLPELLWGFYKEKASGVLVLKRAQVEKRVTLIEGQPVSAESNLLHETLGKFLVDGKVITAEQEQAAVVRALESQKPFQDVLLEMGTVTAAQLYESIRKNFALKILDCFSWVDGEFFFGPDTDVNEELAGLKMNPARLIVQGIATYFPVERLNGLELFRGNRKLRLKVKTQAEMDQLQLTGEEIAILKALDAPKTLEEIAKATGKPTELLRQKLYAFSIFELLELGEGKAEVSLDELVSMTLLASLKPVEPPPPVAKIDPETLKLAEEIAGEHMRLMSLNHFELFGAEEDATAVTIRDRFMAFALKFSPYRFQDPALGEFRSQGEELFLRGVKAYAVLSDIDSKIKYLDKIKAERAKTGKSGKKKAGESFKIETKLLDAEPQFKKGLAYLRDKKYDAAIEHFQYAIDIDARKPSYQAYLAWATFQKTPDRGLKQIEEMLKRARDLTPESEDAAYLLGKFYMANARQAEALPHLKRAAELAPKNIDIVREFRNAERLKK